MDPTYHKDVVCGKTTSTLENFRQSLNVCLQHWDSETISRWHGCLFLMNGGPLLCDYLTYYIRYHRTLNEMSKMVKISKILLLIQHNIGIRVGTKSYTPLMKAIQTESEEIVRALLEKGLDLYDTGTRTTYLEMALDSNTDGQYTLCNLLLEFGYDISTRNMRMQIIPTSENTYIINFNAIFYAVLRQNVEDVKFLLRRGLSPNETALCSTEVGPRNNYCNKPSGLQMQAMTPLFFSIILPNLEISEELLKHGANPNFRTNVGITPLEFSLRHSTYGNVQEDDAMRLLVTYNANMDMKTHFAFGEKVLFEEQEPSEEPYPAFQRHRHEVLRQQKRDALGSALHSRLGAESRLRSLDPEILHYIMQMAL